MNSEEALHELTERYECTKYVDSQYVDAISIEAIEIAIKALKDQRPKAKWILVKPYTFTCSFCGRLEEHQEPFCNCGADMRESEE